MVVLVSGQFHGLKVIEDLVVAIDFPDFAHYLIIESHALQSESEGIYRFKRIDGQLIICEAREGWKRITENELVGI